MLEGDLGDGREDIAAGGCRTCALTMLADLRDAARAAAT
jgi:hypothetical protein